MVDYSKWKDLDFSSDEDDCHPNIEINTWRRLKERMREEKGIKKREPVLIDKWNTTNLNKGKQKYDISGDKSKNESSPPPPSSIPDSSSDMNNNNNTNLITESKQEDEKLNQNDNNNNNNNNNNNESPKNKDSNESLEQKEINISKDINIKKSEDQNKMNNKKNEKIEKHEEDSTFEARSDPQKFLDENLTKLKKYSKMKDDSKADKYLYDNCELIHEAGEGFLITLAVDRAVEDAPKEEIELIAKRCLQIHNIVESCKSANLGPQKGVEVFFTRICHPKLKDSYYLEFNKQLQSLLARIESRRIERLEEAQQQMNENDEENNENAPLGPGGLDPTEVINSLPAEMQEAFVEQNVEKLKQVLAKLDSQEASYHMQRCIDAGLWVENANLDTK